MMSNKKQGFLIIAVIWAALVIGYYLFIFDYKHKTFGWIDSLISFVSLFVVFGGISKLSKDDAE